MKNYIPYSGNQLLNIPSLNKDSAFTYEEREKFNLIGLLPSKIETIEEQSSRVYKQYSSLEKDIDKYVFLRGLQDRNETLFYYVLNQHVSEMMPIVYTPTVGTASTDFSNIFRKGRGLFLSAQDADHIDLIVNSVRDNDIKVIVITDGERVLGLGDLGIGGMAISIGKLSLYSCCGGIPPSKTLPIVIDVGTNNQSLLSDPLYLGLKQPRLTGEDYFNFIDVVIKALQSRWSTAVIQFEDFAQKNAMPLLNKYKDNTNCFNDDIQGTAAVTLGSLISASKKLNRRLSDNVICFLGAGSAGCGIAAYITKQMVTEGLSESEARDRIFMVDKNGLLFENDQNLQEFQTAFARESKLVTEWNIADQSFIDLETVIRNSGANILIGVSGATGAFGESIVEALLCNDPHPIIFPLSNPTSKAEASANQLVEWSNGNAIIATGSPVKPFVFGNKEYNIDQCNNCYIFPGVGLGAIAAKASRVTDNMLLRASRALADYALANVDSDTKILPPLDDIRNLSRHLAFEVAEQAALDGVALYQSAETIQKNIDNIFWEPEYKPYHRVSY
jgi:malate dehydrogenase (oxaloacetate-decarboxylating)